MKAFLAMVALLAACAHARERQAHVKSDYEVTDTVWMRIEDEDGKVFGTIELGLFGNDVPVTVENFKQLAMHTPGFGYKGTPFHRVIKDFMVGGGDCENFDGTGGKNIYGEQYFDDEHFEIKHFENALSMANIGRHTNGSQFLITTTVSPWLDGMHVVFGKLLKGADIIAELESVETNEHDEPLKKVFVADCGVL